MINKETEDKLQILRTFLKEQDIPERRYSIGEYCDESICIEVDGDAWVVYAGDRGNRYEEKMFPEFSDAACHLLTRVAYSHSEEESLVIAFKDYLEKCEADESVTTSKTESFFSHFYNSFVAIIENYYDGNRILYICKHLAVPLMLMIITSIVTYRTMKISVEHSVVSELSERIEAVQVNDSLEEAIDKLIDEINRKNDEIEKLNSEITELQKKIENQNVSDKEKALLEKSISEKEQRVSELEEEKEELQDNLHSVENDEPAMGADYRKYIESGYGGDYIALHKVEILENEGITITTDRDSALSGTEFVNYLGTDSSDEAYIIYNLDQKASSILGYVYIPGWVHEEYDSDDTMISNASVSIEVTYDDSENYQEVYNISGLLVDSEPVRINEKIIGATKLKITIQGGGGPKGNGWDSIIRLGNMKLKYDIENLSEDVSAPEAIIVE